MELLISSAKAKKVFKYRVNSSLTTLEFVVNFRFMVDGKSGMAESVIYAQRIPSNTKNYSTARSFRSASAAKLMTPSTSVYFVPLPITSLSTL